MLLVYLTLGTALRVTSPSELFAAVEEPDGPFTITIANVGSPYLFSRTLHLNRSMELLAESASVELNWQCSSRAILIARPIAVELRGLAIINAEAHDCDPTNDLAIGCRGSGIHVRDGAAVVLNQTEVRDCRGYDGTGIYTVGTASAPTSLLLYEAIVSGNNGSSGAGMYIAQHSIVVMDGRTRFEGNRALYYGGGLAVTSGTAVITGGTIFVRNHGSYGGGAFATFGQARVTLSGGATLMANTAHIRASAFYKTASVVSGPWYDFRIVNHSDTISVVQLASSLLWQCPNGTYMPTTGIFTGDFDGRTGSHCLPCMAGYYGEGADQSAPECTGSCPEGHFCGVRTYTPQPCPAGTRMPSRGAFSMDSCIPCSPGQYENASASMARACPACPAGTYTEDAGASACIGNLIRARTPVSTC